MTVKIIAVVGPTAVGKTALGIELAKRFNGEIISGDSQQVYRHLDIGTAKATLEEQAEAPHHLIDVREVDEAYSAYDFVKEASAAIEDITSRGKLPIIVGGTGLYLQSLLEGYHLGGQVNQEEVLAYRQELEQLADAVLFDKIAEQGIEIPELNRRRAIRDSHGRDYHQPVRPGRCRHRGHPDERRPPRQGLRIRNQRPGRYDPLYFGGLFAGLPRPHSGGVPRQLVPG